MPTLSIIIVNSDGLEDTLRCLESIYAAPPAEPFEVVLVDNCSRLSPWPSVNGRFPLVRQLNAPRRQGFARNYNQGLRAALGEFLLVLNNDTIVHAGALDRMLTALRQHPEYGMAGPLLRSANGQPQTVCARPLISPMRYAWLEFIADPQLPLGRLLDRWAQWRLLRRPDGAVACISGACMLLPRSVLTRLGLLDEGFDFYYEDVEWCHRVWQQGLQVAYIGSAQVTHLGDQSLSKVKVWAKQSEYQSALRYFRQYYNLTPQQARAIRAITALSFLLRGVLLLLREALHGDPTHARAYLYLWAWMLRTPQAGRLEGSQPSKNPCFSTHNGPNI